jgi:hypothetical protein
LRYLKRLVAAMVLFVLVVSIGQGCGASAAVSVKQENTLAFLRDVAGLDMTKYTMAVRREGTIFLYNLTADNSYVEVLCNFRNDKPIACKLYPMSGSPPIVTVPVSDVLSAARRVVDRYQNYSKAPYISDMRDTLNMVSELKVDAEEMASFYTIKKAASASTGNVTLTVWVGANYEDYENGGNVQFEWMNTANGIKNIYNKIIFGIVLIEIC